MWTPGATNAGWPVDLNAAASYNGIPFVSLAQENRGALALVNGIVYNSYSGYLGDCGNYHGWVVGVDINNSANVHGWATTALGGGIWGHSGVASDGTNMFVITGNTFNTGGNWMGGEAIIRLQAGPTWTVSHHWIFGRLQLVLSRQLGHRPWRRQRDADRRAGSKPFAARSRDRKDGNAYLLNRNNLGGIAAPVPS